MEIRNLYFHIKRSNHELITISYSKPRMEEEDFDIELTNIFCNYIISMINTKKLTFPIEVNSFHTPDHYGITMQILPENLTEIINILSFTFNKKQINEVHFTEALSRTHKELKRNRYNLWYKISTVINSKIYPLVNYPDENSLNAIGLSKFHSFYVKSMNTINIICITGNLDENQAESIFYNNFQYVMHNRRIPLKKINVQPVMNDEELKFSDRFPYLVMVSDGFNYCSINKFALHVLWAILNDNQGVFVHSLRNKIPITYSIKIFSKEYYYYGLVYIIIQCSPENYELARGTYIETLKQMMFDKELIERVNRAKSLLINKYFLNELNSAKKNYKETYHFTFNIDDMNYLEHIKAVNIQDVRSMAMHLLEVNKIIVKGC